MKKSSPEGSLPPPASPGSVLMVTGLPGDQLWRPSVYASTCSDKGEGSQASIVSCNHLPNPPSVSPDMQSQSFSSTE